MPHYNCVFPPTSNLKSGGVYFLFYFFKGKYIINKNQISVQDDLDRGYKTNKPHISGTPIKIPKQIPPNRGSLLTLISFLERNSSTSKAQEKTSTSQCVKISIVFITSFIERKYSKLPHYKYS
jgi:hypothetical protein